MFSGICKQVPGMFGLRKMAGSSVAQATTQQGGVLLRDR